MPPKITDPVELAALRKKFMNDPLTIRLTPANRWRIEQGRQIVLSEMLAPLLGTSRQESDSEAPPESDQASIPRQ